MNTTYIDIIAEVKLKSPSHGSFKIPNLKKLIISYEDGGANMISVITDKERFGGSLDLLKKVRELTSLPILRKDFLSTKKDMDETLEAGATCVLVIARDHTHNKTLELTKYALSIGLEVLVELHNKKDFSLINKLPKEAKIGINNRDLVTLKTDSNFAISFLDKIPDDRYIVAESGFSKPEELATYSKKINAALIGSSLLTSSNPAKLLSQLKKTALAKELTFARNQQRISYFGEYGGQFIPELLIKPLQEVEFAFNKFKNDKAFINKLNVLLDTYAGRPTPLYKAENLSRELKFNLYLKREDLLHGGAHKTNNTLGQGLLADAMGKKELIAETGAGQHGVAVAMIGALLKKKVKIFMGARDIERQHLNVQRMKLYGAEVVSVTSGSKTLKDAINEALRYYSANSKNTFYIFGTAAGPHPFPTIVRHFQSIIGTESREQILNETKQLPTIVCACVGGGSNAIGIFSAFINDETVKLIGVEAAGGASLTNGTPAILHGSRSYCLQDSNGSISESQSISAGLDYPGVGPEHSKLKDIKRVIYTTATDAQALYAFKKLSKDEGIIPALESSHALAYVLSLKGKLPRTATVIVNLSGRGDKDLTTVEKYI